MYISAIIWPYDPPSTPSQKRKAFNKIQMCEKEISLGQICVLILDDIPDYHLSSQCLGPETPGTLTFYVSCGFHIKKDSPKDLGSAHFVYFGRKS